jgi:SAM-dependent methyltransferase
MADDAYEVFARRYDMFYEAFGEHPQDVVAFFRDIFAARGVRSVLDCACGTGHDLILFHSLGLEVLASDISDAMLKQAGKNLAERGVDIPPEKADYRELPQHFDRRFDAVVCLSSSILEMPDETEVVGALTSMRDVLNDDGVLVLSQGTTDRQWNARPRFILAVNKHDFSRLFVIDYEDRGARYNVIDIFHGSGDYDFKVWTAHYHMMLLRDDLERLLVRAGFSTVEFYGSYDLTPYDKASSDILITVAGK